MKQKADLRLENCRRVRSEGEFGKASREARREQRLLVACSPGSSSTDEHAHKRDDQAGIDDFLLRPRLEREGGERGGSKGGGLRE